jgi:hypothetical protein
MGCVNISIPGKDGEPPVRAIICGVRRPKSKPCWVSHCGKPNTKLCDWPVGDGKTCDAPICDKHATNVGPDRDVCPLHAIEGGWK